MMSSEKRRAGHATSTLPEAALPGSAPQGAEASQASATRRRITRGISVTWWYTVSAVFLFEAMLVLIWTGLLVMRGATQGTGPGTAQVLIVLIGGTAWVIATAPLLLRYRQEGDPAVAVRWRRVMLPLAVSLGYGLVAGLASESWMMAVLPLAQSLALLGWPAGVRIRLVLAVTALLAILAVIDWRAVQFTEPSVEYLREWLFPMAFTIVLPAMTASSLWWWDVIVNLDRARAAEARLGATQERLRVATDVHDLQGHHLQVVALQLELTERLMARDPDAALEQLRLARASVTAAQQGTRDLALQFQSVPLSDEIANAVDLLSAAGAAVESSLAAGSDQAPASVLGPVIRETTTNVLRHGGGRWAKLVLDRAGGAGGTDGAGGSGGAGSAWRYTISNDTSTDAAAAGDGSGLAGIARRIAEAGGTVDVQRGKHDFTVVVEIPGEEA